MIHWPSPVRGASQGQISGDRGWHGTTAAQEKAGWFQTRVCLQCPDLGKTSSGSLRCQWKLKQAAPKRVGFGRQDLAGENPKCLGPRLIRGWHHQAMMNAGS